jgi:hypothetical protein
MQAEDVQVFLADVTIDRSPPPVRDVGAHLDKYRAEIEAIDTTPEAMSATYNGPLRAVPTKLRGM